MVKALKVKKAVAEQAKKFVIAKGWLAPHLIGKTQRYVLIPLTDDANFELLEKKFSGKIEEKNLPKLESKGFRQYLADFLPKGKIELVHRAFDVIGDIAVIELPPELDRLATSIAWALKRANPQIKVVAQKAGKVSGIYRIRPLKILVGEKRTWTVHKEHGVQIKIDLAKAYFTPRSSGERARIARQIKPGEKVLVLFAGVGPYALVGAKAQPRATFTAVELNPAACKLAKENVRINRLPNIKIVCADARAFVERTKEKFDRIISVLPEQAWQFADLLFKAAKKNAHAHFYLFEHEAKLKEAEKRLRELAKKFGRKIKSLQFKKAGSYSPRIWRWCADFTIE